jgi:hypothetical protein
VFKKNCKRLNLNSDLILQVKQEVKQNLEKKDAKEEDASGERELFCDGIETWLNNTLKEGENLGIPGILIKPSHKKPLTRYGIDKMQLISADIKNADCQRIYKALFVYSVGFY